MKPIVWREAIADSELDATAKLVAHTISTYMNGAGDSFPGKDAIAKRSSLGKRAVDRAIDRLEAHGYLRVERSKGRRPNHYWADVPNHVAGTGFTQSTVSLEEPTVSLETSNRVAGTPELDLKANESVKAALHSETDEERRARASELRKGFPHLLRSVPE
jgi:DNA-binding transcriptional MocR family regulator